VKRSPTTTEENTMPHALARIATAALGAATLLAAALPAHAQWAIDYTVRYEAAGQQLGKPGELRGPDTLVSEKITWRVLQEVRGTLNYTQKVRGAVASNMPDKNNEQRYDSWISRAGNAGTPAWMKLDAEEVMDSAVRLAKADGEGAGELNRERAGKLGRVEYLRTRITLAGEGPGAAKLNNPFVQIDRVDGKLHFEPPAIEFDPAQVRYLVEKVVRMDKPAAAGEWDSSGTKAQRTMAQLRLPLLPVQVFDMPRDAQSFEATRTVDVPGPTGGKATMTISLRRSGAAPAVAGAPTAATAPSAKATPAPTATAPAAAATDRAKADCPPLAADGAAAGAAAGADVGGKALGGGYGRQVGSAVGGFLGALAGTAKTAEPAAQDCPR
jgi:hypothetical protein